jgi:hypothetical protein
VTGIPTVPGETTCNDVHAATTASSVANTVANRPQARGCSSPEAVRRRRIPAAVKAAATASATRNATARARDPRRWAERGSRMTPPTAGRALKPDSDSPSMVQHPRQIVPDNQRAALADAKDQPGVKDSRQHRFLVLVRAHECAPGDRTSDLRKRWCARTKREAKTSRLTRGCAEQHRSERDSSQETKHP